MDDLWPIGRRNCNCGHCDPCKAAARRFARKHPIKDRIHDVLDRAGGKLDYHAAMHQVFPKEVYPNAHRYSSNGGPSGCAMAFGRALSRYKFYESPWPNRKVSRHAGTVQRTKINTHTVEEDHG